MGHARCQPARGSAEQASQLAVTRGIARTCRVRFTSHAPHRGRARATKVWCLSDGFVTPESLVGDRCAGLWELTLERIDHHGGVGVWAGEVVREGELLTSESGRARPRAVKAWFSRDGIAARGRRDRSQLPRVQRSSVTGGGMTQITAVLQERQYVASRAESPPRVRRVPLGHCSEQSRRKAVTQSHGATAARRYARRAASDRHGRRGGPATFCHPDGAQ